MALGSDQVIHQAMRRGEFAGERPALIIEFLDEQDVCGQPAVRLLVHEPLHLAELELIRTAVLLTGDRATAEDIVQDAFLGLYRALPRLRDDGRVAGYLRVSVVNGCRSVLRARRRASLVRVVHDPPAWSAESAVLAEEDRRAVIWALGRLPLRTREVVVLRYFLDLPHAEIAAILGVSRGTVSSTISRALDRLGRDLRESM